MSRFLSFTLSILLLLQLSPWAFAKEVRLFTSRFQPSPQCSEMIAGLQAGDELRFNDGKKFIFVEYAGHGNSSHVLRVEGGIVLRLPLIAGHVLTHEDRDFDWRLKAERHREYHSIMELLATTTLPVPKLGDPVPNFEYEAMEDVRIAFRLDEFLSSLKRLKSDPVDIQARRNYQGVEPKLKPSSEQAYAFMAALEKFLVSSWEIVELGDFRASQVGWSLKYKKWMLLDAMNSVKFAESESDESLFTELAQSWKFDADFAKRVSEQIRALRQDHFQTSGIICGAIF